ncbi:hypothetical protein QBC33DRAFT_487027 [Phialemonium atrogriseum]|uniref:Glycoside hydrolase 131 catalytic N-terminal domain-containing protein n=1 Tax=Phialemonium atrogriseum TaxID=1093897 RepID=A0AAJ0FJK6_9PEZI|nr:uncharacterized protein QBC33DRAFT_487027 [Phialemonium atrogriseum]KAK1770022.1 hypothetical protein QBC33DRAFT_487027 [Phialemonium atrogriseum]
MIGTTVLLALVSAASAASLPCRQVDTPAEVKCPIVFDGRVSSSLSAADFDSSSTSPFNPDYVKGEGLKWSEILKFPADAGRARFDDDTKKAFEVTISDKSIFQTQKGFRRAGLQFKGDSNDASPAVKGVKTIHFSVKLDPQRPLNLSHEYLNVWHEAADYSANQFNFEAGAIIGQDSLAKDTWKVLNRQNNQVWSTPIEKDAWQNFAITLDFNKNTLQVYYSKGSDPLKSVTSAVTNDNSGAGQFQIGILKKPTGTSDVVNAGYQESGLNEGLIYGSLFVEDSDNACVSL